MSIKNIFTSIMVAAMLAAPIVYSEMGARYEHETVTVHDGDTLFSLISEREPEGDIWESIYHTRELNGLENNKYLHTGDEFVLVIRKE